MDAVETKQSSPATRTRIAGALYVFSFVSAILAEAFVRGKMMYAAGLVPVLCFTVVTLILYRIFIPVSRVISLLAALLNLASLAFEALELRPGGVNVALILHGGFCLLTALLVLKSKFLPRTLSVPMVFAGLAWLISLLPQAAGELHAYAQATGFAGEGIFMLWLLARGVDDTEWHERARSQSLP